ncbi:MAG TPA: Ig-like domain-containing protein, partial [Spirochaetota bacterium]|nr:Ig-like domain-containing protein [Spirochaetota bacterium]
MRYLFIFYWISFCCSCYLPPAVAGVTPAAGSSNIVSNSEITLTFTQPMNRLTVEENFTLTKNKQTSVKGIFRWQARQVTFTPEQFLIYGNKYYITVGENAENSRGVDLDSSFSSMFTAGRILSAFRLTYSSLQGITNLTNRHAPLCFKFCRQIRLDNFIKNFTVNPAPALNFFLTNNNTAAAVFFTAELQRGQHYKVKLQQEMGDIYGNTLNSSREWHFTAGKHFYNFQLKKVLLDSGTPLKEDRIISNAALDTDFRFVFSHAVDFTSFIENVIFADNLQGELLQTNPSNIIFTPDRLTGEKLYTVRIKPNLKDRHGNLLG